VVGRNGAGKTSTLRCLAGIVPLDSGRAECGGRVASLLELGAGFGEDFTGRENILLNGALHGFTRAEIEDRLDAIVEFSELGEFIDVPVKSYSAGMFLRLGFSIASHLDADVLLIDEVLAVGDESFQRKCLARISEQMAAGATLVMVSHDPTAIERVCQRVVVLDRGQVSFDGAAAEGLLFYHRMLGTADAPRGLLRPEGGREPVEVRELELKDADGHSRHVFRPGDAMRVEMLVVAERSRRAVVAIEVRAADGKLCFRTDQSLGELDGATRAVFDIPSLALLGGDYDMAAGAVDQNVPVGLTMERVAGFSVAPTSDGEGVADLRGSWSFEPVRTGQEAVR
jgi:ABC-type polysaccharide/polyol phosphate transport system ATPase subunit